MQVWNMLHAARWKCKTQKIAKKSPSAHHRTTLSGYIFVTKARIDNRKKNLLSSNISSRCPHNMVNVVFITGRPPYAFVNHRRQSFSCRRRTRVERSAAARNIRILSVYFSQTSEDSSLPVLFPLTVCVVPEQWLLSFSDTLIVRVTYNYGHKYIQPLQRYAYTRQMTVSQKRQPLTCYNFDAREWILIFLAEMLYQRKQSKDALLCYLK